MVISFLWQRGDRSWQTDQTSDPSFATLIETITSDIILISFSQYITKIQDHRHGPFSFPNCKETGFFVVSLDHIGGI